MLKFFRRIRQKLIHEGNPKRYLIYATGEIFLVMIGILLALQVNNWNGQRKAEIEFELLVLAVENELIGTIEQATRSINYGLRKDSLIHVFQLDTITLDGLKNGHSKIPLIGNQPITFDSENIQLLLEKSKDFPQKYASLLPMLKQYQLFADNQRKYLDLAIEHANDFRIQQANSYPWFGRTDSINNQEALDFYLNDFLYRNHIYLHRIRNRNNMSLITGIRSISLGIVLAINHMIEGVDNQELIAFSQKLDLTPFQELDCEDDLVSSDKEFWIGPFYLFVNSLNRSINIYSINDNGERLNKFTLNAKEIISSYPTRYSGGEGHFEMVNEKDECIKKYQTSRHGFLLLKE